MTAVRQSTARKWIWALAGGLIVYLVLIRWLLIGFLYDQDLLSWYTILIEKYNQLTRTNFGQGPHPLEEYRQRIDILLFQVSLLAAVVLGLRYVARSRERILLLAINGFALLVILFVVEAILSTDRMQEKLGSVEFEAANRTINELNEGKVNSLGFTDRERERARAPGVYRIVVLGDSFVWGDGVANLDDTWSHVLESLLVERYTDSVEVISWGRNGWSTYNQLAFLKERGSEFDIDLVIIGLVRNDAHIPGVSMARRLFVWHKVATRVTPFYDNTVRFLSTRVNNVLYGLDYFENWGMSGWRKALRSEENLAAYGQVVGQLKNHLERRGIEFFFVSLPTVGEGDVNAQFEPLLQVLAENDVDYLDLSPSVLRNYGHYTVAQIRDELWTNPANGHPGRVLTDLYASDTLDYLVSDFGLERRMRLRHETREVTQAPDG